MARKLALSLAVIGTAGLLACAGASRSASSPAAEPPSLGAATASAPAVHVAPATGGPHTRFVVSFRAPDRTGRSGSMRRYYVVEASRPGAARGCVSTVAVTAPYTPARAFVRVTLAPTHSRWCTGAFRGRVQELQAPVCPAGKICPAYLVLLRTVGRLTFHVHA